jgi:hypothetical protein
MYKDGQKLQSNGVEDITQEQGLEKKHFNYKGT